MDKYLNDDQIDYETKYLIFIFKNTSYDLIIF